MLQNSKNYNEIICVCCEFTFIDTCSIGMIPRYVNVLLLCSLCGKDLDPAQCKIAKTNSNPMNYLGKTKFFQILYTDDHKVTKHETIIGK